MIVTKLDCSAQEVAMTPSLQKAFDALRRENWQHQPDGQLEIDGDRVFAFVQSYETRSTSYDRLEAHRKHIDIHFIVSGEETIAWLPAVHLEPDEPYDPDRDVWWGRVTVSEDCVTAIRLYPGQIAVFFPSDGHLPRRASRRPDLVKKVLVKVAVP